MQKLLKQNVLTENKFQSKCRNYLNNIRLPINNFHAEPMQKLLKQNGFTEIDLKSECRNYLNKMRLLRISSRANVEIT
jgi:hypothetical protein